MTDSADRGGAPRAIDAVPRPSHWHRRARWFVSEFFVVVTGVIVALALNAWWQDRQDAKRESIYLRQLNADLKASDTELGDAREFFTGAARASAIVCHQFWRRDGLSNEAIHETMLVPMRSGRALPVLGTARALIASGDLRLIRSIELRNAVTTYVDAMDSHVADSIRFDETYYREGIHTINASIDLNPLPSPTPIDRALSQRPDETTPPPFPFDVNAALKDRTVYKGFKMLLIGHRGQANRYGDMQDKTRALQKQIESILANVSR